MLGEWGVLEIIIWQRLEKLSVKLVWPAKGTAFLWDKERA